MKYCSWKRKQNEKQSRFLARKSLFTALSAFLIFVCSMGPHLFPVESQPPDQLEKLPQFLQEEMETWQVPGIAVAVIKNHKVIFSKGFGYTDLKKTAKITPQTMFSIASCTKAFTVTLAGILVDQGKLEWDLPVRNYVSQFKLMDPVASENTTLTDMFSHRTGLSRQDFLRSNMPASRQEVMRRLAFIEPAHSFRTRWEYSNLIFTTAGFIMERVTGKSWEESIKTRIFEPLGMKRSVFSVEDMKKMTDVARPHIQQENGIEEMAFQNNDVLGPAGAICSNVEDLSQWVLFNLNKGKVNGNAVISPRTLNHIHSPLVVVPRPPRYKELYYDNYAMGWFVTNYRGHRHIHHGGVLFGYSAMVSFMPDDGIGVVILANLNGTPMTSIVERYIYDRLLGLEPLPWNQRIRGSWLKMVEYYKKMMDAPDKNKRAGTKPSHPLEAYVGKYNNPAYGTVSIEKDQEGLKALLTEFVCALPHYHYDIFEMVNEIKGDRRKVFFGTADNGEIDSFQLEMFCPGPTDPHRALFKRIPAQKTPPENPAK